MMRRRSLLLGGAAALVAPQAWAQQIPFGRAQVPPFGNPSIISTSLSSGLAFLWLASPLQLDIATGVIGSYGASIPLVGPYGQYITFPTAGALFSENPVKTSNSSGTGDLTLACLSQANTGTVSPFGEFDQIDQASSSVNVQLFSGADHLGNIAAGLFGFGLTDGTNFLGATTNSSGADGNWHVYVGRRSGSTHQIFVDGIDKTNTSGNGNPSLSLATGTTIAVGSDFANDSNSVANGPIAMAAAWNRALTNQEIASYFKTIAYQQLLSQLVIWPIDLLAAMGTRTIRPADSAIFAAPF